MVCTFVSNALQKINQSKVHLYLSQLNFMNFVDLAASEQGLKSLASIIIIIMSEDDAL